MTERPHTDIESIRESYSGPLERVFDRIISPFEEFIHKQTTSGRLLMACAVIALILANSPLSDAYAHLLHTPLGLHLGNWELSKTLHHWINDGLMALFFFIVGLEIKRELLVGELADPRQAILPIVAAIGGMVVPALLYFLINPQGAAASGWGIPMATDIAFAVGVLALLGNRIPKSLLTFLVALAIVDDLGGVLVIALFYTEKIALLPLAMAGLLLGLLVLANVVGIRRPLAYFILGALLWLAMLESGIHATLAGVLTALAIPARSKYDPALFSQHVRQLMNAYDEHHQPGTSIMRNERLHSILQTLENGVQMVETPLQRLEHGLHLPVALLIIPIFALANAAIPLPLDSLVQTLSHPVTLGVATGLVGGKVLGIVGLSWLAIRLGWAKLPPHSSMSQLLGVGLIGGIGFTMSIFIAELAFAGQPQLLLMAKTGVLFASLCAGVLGLVWLILVTPKTDAANN